jgi:hypothetical protein
MKPTKPEAAMPSIAVAAAVNNPRVLANCLERSPDIAEGRLALRTYRDFPSASAAYNQGLDEAGADVVAFAHQDVYLPRGFLARAQRHVAALTARDPDWAVAGVIGIDPAGATRGETWSTGIGKVVGKPIDDIAEVVTLDEVLLLVRRASGLRFDPEMPSFHLYAADAVQTARANGQKSYVVPLPIVHHSRPVVRLDGGYQAAYRFMQRKWRDDLPLPNLVCPIRSSMLPLRLQDLRIRWRKRGQARPPEPTDDPGLIAERLGW